MRYRLFLFVLITGLAAASPVAAESWTCLPMDEIYGTGYTDGSSKTDGTVLVYGGEVDQAPKKENGFFKFDISAIPDTTTVTAIQFFYFVSAANDPFWSVTPVSGDPLITLASPLWDDVQAEIESNYYLFYYDAPPGWAEGTLGGTAVADLNSILGGGQDWFALGAASRDDELPEFFLEIDGRSDTNVPYIVVYNGYLPPNSTCDGATPILPVPGVSSYLGETATAGLDYDCEASCVNGLDHPGPDVTYRVDLSAGCEICVSLNQSEIDWNTGIYMISDCANPDATCVAGSSDWTPGSFDESFCYQSTAGGTYYIVVDTRSGSLGGDFEMDVVVTCLSAPDGLSCSADGSGVTLQWTNNDNYDAIEIWMDGGLEETIDGASESHLFTGAGTGYHCFVVCGTSGTGSVCSEVCCLITGFDITQQLWDFNSDNGGFVTGGDDAWEWGSATYGACAGAADGGVWGTDLDFTYPAGACAVLDSPGIQLGPGGGYICFEHCYEIETQYDGGTVWFTTDELNYFLLEPLDGYDGDNVGSVPSCQWVQNKSSFQGSSNGWVTDHWDLTHNKWSNETVTLRLAFASDSNYQFAGWVIDNVSVFRDGLETVDCTYVILPISGTVPFSANHDVTLENLYSGFTRRLAARIDVRIANGNQYSNWKSGWSNVAASGQFNVSWVTGIPAQANVVGQNLFTLQVEDVTPSPYNQPPHPSAGDTCTVVNTLQAHAP